MIPTDHLQLDVNVRATAYCGSCILLDPPLFQFVFQLKKWNTFDFIHSKILFGKKINSIPFVDNPYLLLE
jgi:hypothetical protein